MQPDSLDVRQKLRQRFLSAGLAECSSSMTDPKPDLFFQTDGATACVVILECDHWADRQALLGSLLRASALVGKANRTYLAIPKSTASIVDARPFHERGIGLFTYDQRNMDEALPARHFEMNNLPPSVAQAPISAQLETELHELRIQFDLLETVVQQLKEEVASARERGIPERAFPAVAQPNPPQGITIMNGLPAFIAGNPWVDVLSRRGREGSTIAG